MIKTASDQEDRVDEAESRFSLWQLERPGTSFEMQSELHGQLK